MTTISQNAHAEPEQLTLFDFMDSDAEAVAADLRATEIEHNTREKAQ
jgi:hypothetical protein